MYKFLKKTITVNYYLMRRGNERKCKMVVRLPCGVCSKGVGRNSLQ